MDKLSVVLHDAQQTNNSNNINLSGDGATRRVLNPDTAATKALQGIGWADINTLKGNVIFFSEKPIREAEAQPTTLPAPFHLLQGAPWIIIDGSLVLGSSVHIPARRASRCGEEHPSPRSSIHSCPAPLLCPACAPSDFISGAAAGSGSRIQSVFVARERLDNDNLCVRAEPRQR